jgi:hypothetical protein
MGGEKEEEEEEEEESDDDDARAVVVLSQALRDMSDWDISVLCGALGIAGFFGESVKYRNGHALLICGPQEAIDAWTQPSNWEKFSSKTRANVRVLDAWQCAGHAMMKVQDAIAERGK